LLRVRLALDSVDLLADGCDARGLVAQHRAPSLLCPDL